MPHSEQWARRLLREMPANPEALLRNRKYADPVFLAFFLDHVEERIYRDPGAGLKLARVAPKLARLVPDEDRQTEHREQLALAHAVLAGAYRATGRPSVAESEFVRALEIADSASVSPSVRAQLYRRLAVLRACQKRFTEALALADRSVETFGKLKDHHGLTIATTTRGFVLNESGRFHEAIRSHGEALRLAGEAIRRAGRKQPAAGILRAHEAARINLALAASQVGSTHPAQGYISAARRALRGKRRCIQRHRLRWIEGQVWLKAPHHLPRAKRAFQIARRGFLQLGAPWELALCSLDLATLYRAGERWAELEALAADTFGRFRELAADFEAIAALSLWVEAVEARRGVSAAIAAARETLEARKARP